MAQRQHDVDEEYEVESIQSKVKFGAEVYYLVKWVGWDASENTWEPAANLLCSQETIEEYETAHEDLFKPLGRDYRWPRLKMTRLPNTQDGLVRVGPENWVVNEGFNISETGNDQFSSWKLKRISGHYWESPQRLGYLEKTLRLVVVVESRENKGTEMMSCATVEGLADTYPRMLVDYLAEVVRF